MLVETMLPLNDIIYNNGTVDQEFIVHTPTLWSPDMPALYVAESRLYKNGTELKDEYTTPFGIRSIEIIPGKGFFLNGEKTVFKGCLLYTSGRSICVTSPVMIILAFIPKRVRNILIWCVVVFCASSRIITASFSVRPRIKANGAI